MTVLPGSVARAADAHIVPLPEIQRRAVAATEQRRQNIAELDGFFSSRSASLQAAGMDGVQVTRAVAMLNDDELNRMAAQARKARTDFAAGALNNQEITYILIALATAVLVLIIVEH